ncbi:hypothetical protein H9650_19680 [Psychrobacillus sp. Sa2BUA9]|uniref:Uncharacterized protein n=2 Tax=Psychrobacillus TaxID=1221880 RepID=A0ABR8REY4_9BACI|nr:hypothetical protein [Psychrobacillus faecigallinarum]MBD7946326.1 hypothetical protein [Psychrobacillus faecigallinarum]QGM30506.1 hypothetical protein GI482_09010 [Bacillus sp. N3536]
MYEVFESETGVFVSLKEEYKSYYLTVFATVNMQGQEITQVIEYDPGIFGNMSIPMEGMTPEGNMMKLDYTHLGVIISKLPFNVITPGSFVKAYGVNFVLKEIPVETKDVMYAFVGNTKENIKGLSCISLKFITNISNFREDFMNDIAFESSGETTELYPVANGLSYHYGNLVQVVDGVVTSVLANNDIS